MADIYHLGQVGLKLSGKLQDYDDQDNIVSISLAGYTRTFIRFRKPDGTISEHPAEPDTPSNLADTDIVFDSDENILDQAGNWEYTFGVEYNDGTLYVSPLYRPFLVNV